VDGAYALSHQDAATREYRDEFAYPGVQPETRDGDLGAQATNGGNAGMRPVFFPEIVGSVSAFCGHGFSQQWAEKNSSDMPVVETTASGSCGRLQVQSQRPADSEFEFSHSLGRFRRLTRRAKAPNYRLGDSRIARCLQFGHATDPFPEVGVLQLCEMQN